MHAQDLTGTPDFYFPLKGIAVFVDGCFWHGCPKCGHIPKANRSYWRAKLAGNKRRDMRVQTALSEDGIRVVRIWECRLRDEPALCMRKLVSVLGHPQTFPALQGDGPNQ